MLSMIGRTFTEGVGKVATRYVSTMSLIVREGEEAALQTTFNGMDLFPAAASICAAAGAMGAGSTLMGEAPSLDYASMQDAMKAGCYI